MKKTNNKGFSLVELIIVIAIMAVLIGVLAPQFLRYVERSREQKDATAVEELRNATEIALADEAIYQEVISLTTGATPVAHNLTVNVAAAGAGAAAVTRAITTNSALLLTELTASIGATMDLSSNDYAGGATITITPDAATGTVTVTAAP